MDAQDMGDALERILVTEDELSRRMRELAAQIDADYQGKELLLVGVLKGALMVMADLSRNLHTPLAMDWMAVSSYGTGTKSSGVVRILKDLDADVHGRDVLIVEDIIDSGLAVQLRSKSLQHFASLKLQRSMLTSSTSVLISPTNSSWATASTMQSATVIFPSSGPWRRMFMAAERGFHGK